MPMRCYFLTRQVTIKFWPVYKSRSIFWTDFEDLKGRLIHCKIRYFQEGLFFLLGGGALLSEFHGMRQ